MSRQELAEAVNDYLWQRYRRQEHLDDTDIGKLERGTVRWPGAHRREAFRAVLGAVSDAEIGFYFNRRQLSTSARPEDVRLGGEHGPFRASMAAAVPQVPAAGALDVSAGSRSPLAGDDGTWGRSEVLRAILGAGVLPLLGSLPLDPEVAETGPGGAGAEAYDQMAHRLWVLYWSAPAGPLFDAAYAHARLGIELVRGASVTARVSITSTVARSALLAARLAFFDLSRPRLANRCFGVALTAAGEADDPTMLAAVLGHMAFGPTFARRPEDARVLIAAAFSQVRRSSSLVRSWLHCVASEAEARAHNGAASMRQTDLAEATFTPDEPAPAWFDFYDRMRLHCFAGYAALAVGDRPLAASRLSSAIVELGRRDSKQRSVVMADLAAACHGDADRAAHHLHQAVDALESSWYRVGFDRVHEARVSLGDSRLGAQLEKRLATLTVAGSGR